MKALVGAFNQEKALVGAFSVITNLRVDLRLSYQALVEYHLGVKAGTRGGWAQFCSWMSSTASFRSRPQPGDTPTRRPALHRQLDHQLRKYFYHLSRRRTTAVQERYSANTGLCHDWAARVRMVKHLQQSAASKQIISKSKLQLHL